MRFLLEHEISLRRSKSLSLGENVRYEKVQVKVPVRKAASVPPLGPILGQHQININKFCNEFNEKSEDSVYSTGVAVSVTINKRIVIKERIGKLKAEHQVYYEFEIGEPSMVDLMKGMLENRGIVPIMLVYDMLRFFCKLNGIQELRKSDLKIILSVLRSMKINNIRI